MFVFATVPDVNTASYPINTRDMFFRDLVLGAQSRPPTSNSCEVQEFMEVYLHCPILL
jgi:hypothetical protein